MRVVLLIGLLWASSCRQGMYDQPRYEPYERTDFFADESAARLPPENTVARGELRADEHFYEGITEGGRPASVFPYAVSETMLRRGREVFDVYCTPCHGPLGEGDGIVVRHGFSPPPSLHLERLRNAPPGHFFQVISNGYGAMYDYRNRVRPHDRWAVAAYIQALQLSRRVRLSSLPEKLQAEFARQVTRE